ncbi:MAG: hypothetical protein NC417_11750 [Candidatus Gastranaerophilales bacterium]|nr:hypothetical protein [Candidatus Gastranaerophilales bacterium]
MELLHIDGISDKKQCHIYVSETDFVIEGDFYYLVNKEFCPVKDGRDTCSIKEYLGLGSLRKRSPKKLIQFIVLACILELFDMIAGKLGDYLFFINTDWTSYFVNAAAILCMIQGLRLFFSKKKVTEISFLSKRFCVDEKLFRNEDMDKLHRILIKLR